MIPEGAERNNLNRSPSNIVVFTIFGAVVSAILILLIHEWHRRLTPEPIEIDVTDNPERREGILPGGTYLLPDGLYLKKGERLSLERMSSGIDATHPWGPTQKPTLKSKVEYEADPSQWPEVVCLLGDEATYRVERILLFSSSSIIGLEVTGSVTDRGKVYDHVSWWRPDLRQLQGKH